MVAEILHQMWKEVMEMKWITVDDIFVVLALFIVMGIMGLLYVVTKYILVLYMIYAIAIMLIVFITVCVIYAILMSIK